MAESFMLLVLACFYLMLPAYFANMAPVIVKKINFLRIPIDLGKKINNRPIFGENKTYRGLVFGVIFAIIIAYIQFLLYSNNILVNLAIIDYSNWLLFGFLMGLGALLGDLIESFVKRRLSYESGKPFVPFDQTDFIIGALILAYPLIRISLDKIIIILVMSIVLHILVNHFAYYTKIRGEKW